MGTKTNPTNGLTQKQKSAADHYLVHGNKANAYEHAYDCSRMKEKSISRKAVELFQHPNVMRYIDECRKLDTSRSIMSRKEALEILSNIAKANATERTTDQIKSIERISKMMGWDEAQKVEHSGGITFNINLNAEEDPDND